MSMVERLAIPKGYGLLARLKNASRLMPLSRLTCVAPFGLQFGIQDRMDWPNFLARPYKRSTSACPIRDDIDARGSKSGMSANYNY